MSILASKPNNSHRGWVSLETILVYVVDEGLKLTYRLAEGLHFQV